VLSLLNKSLLVKIFNQNRKFLSFDALGKITLNISQQVMPYGTCFMNLFYEPVL